MLFAPHTVRLRSERPPAQVCAALQAALKDPSASNFSQARAGYLGRVDGASFEVTWSPAFNRQLRPLCVGTVRAEADGTRVDLVVRPNPSLLGFAAIWSFVAIPSIWYTGQATLGTPGTLALIVGALAFVVGLFAIRHRWDVQRSVAALCETLGARVRVEDPPG